MKTVFDINLAVPGLPFSGVTFDKQGLGGAETSGYYMARALAKLGHRVTVFCNTAEAVRCSDVDYLPLHLFRQMAEFSAHDVCIAQRVPELLAGQCRSKFTAFWCHDLAIGRSGEKINGASWNYDKLFVLSEFMRTQYKQVYGMPDELLYVTRNGVDLGTVQRVRERLKGKNAPRNPLSLVYSARPERGLDVLLGEVMPRILEHEPAARLFLSTYDNPVTHLQDFYSHCDRLAAALGDRVVKLGSLTKEQLYEVYLTAGLYVYPVPSRFAPDFDEVSCISMLEAQACGLPIVTSARGALPETVAPGAGVLIAEAPHTEAYAQAFAHAALRLLRTPEEWRAASAAGLARAETLGWDAVAREWTELFEREIRKDSADLGTLANHFYRHSDIYAAKECLRRLPADDAKSRYVREQIAEHWAFTEEPEGFRKQYERIGGTHDAAVINWAPQEPRFAVMRDWLTAHQADVKSVLDYGCAHGAYATNLLKQLPHLSVTGVDIDSHGIEMGYAFAEQLGVKERWRGVVGDYTRLSDADVPEMTERYDCVVAQEVLEHVPNPCAVLSALEQRVRDGGWVYITVPSGPWEYSDYGRYPHRAHVWEFDLHDLHELLDVKGKEADVTISAMPAWASPETQEPMGWWVVHYRVTESTRGVLGTIDMERKLWLQRPRQTVSASIIAGPNCEETLLWTLRSLTHVADEVVVVDCGMSPLAAALAKAELKSKLVLVENGPDPKTQGFETPRNLGLARCTQDWVLWIDTDEKLLQPEGLHKYLRSNLFQGYSLRQHHFAVDTHFDPDLPVRLFRNNGKLRFIGCVAGDTPIETPSGAVPIREFVGKQPWIYAFDAEKDRLVLTKPSEVRMTKRQAKVLAITLDDGTAIKATPEHPFLLRQRYHSANKWKRADELKAGDRLMPFHRRWDGDYPIVRRSSCDWVSESHFVCGEQGIEVSDGHHVHHVDLNPANNDPTNLSVLSKGEHSSLHHKGKVLSVETRRLISENHASCDGEHNAMYGRKHSGDTKQKIGTKSLERGAGHGNSSKGWFTPDRVRDLNSKLWADPEHRAKRLAAIRVAKGLPENHRVVKVEEAGYEDVFNMNVPGVHSFIAGGVVVHNCIHEHPESDINQGPGRTVVLGDVHIAHVGYLIESGRKVRFARNLPMLQKDRAKYPTRLLQKHFIMRDNMLICSYELQRTAGQVTPEMRRLSEETVALYREYFLGKPFMSNSDPLQYYSQALALLGRGVEFAWQVAADKLSAQPNGVSKARFENTEEAAIEISHRVRSAGERFDSRYW